MLALLQSVLDGGVISIYLALITTIVLRNWHLLIIRTLHYKLSGAMPRCQPI
jgi:hypothetical protein